MGGGGTTRIPEPLLAAFSKETPWTPTLLKEKGTRRLEGFGGIGFDGLIEEDPLYSSMILLSKFKYDLIVFALHAY